MKLRFLSLFAAAILIAPQAFAFSPFSAGQCSHLFATQPSSLRFNSESLVRDYSRMDFFGLESKKEFVDYAKKNQRSENMFFIDIENSLLKVLNDFTSDKTLITSLTNLHKKMIADALTELLRSNSNIATLAYSDFKSLRFAFYFKSPTSAEKSGFQEALQTLFIGTNRDYVAALELLGLNIMNSGKFWFRGGVGMTADEANMAARAAREDKLENKLFDFSSGNLRESLWSWQKSSEKKRDKLKKTLGRTPLFSDDGFLTVGAIDIIRKAKKKSEIIERVQKKFKIKLEEYQAELLKSYMNEVDRFAPGLYVVDRRIASLERAVFGGLSADFAGLGAKNLDATARAISLSVDIDDLLVRVRLAEVRVTDEFQKLLAEFDKVLKDFYEIRIPSGDDFIGYSQRAKSEREKYEILQRLANIGLASGVRLAFIGEGVHESENGLSHRGLLAAHGESIEKDLRVALEGKVSDKVLAGLTFAVNMEGLLAGTGGVQLFVGQNLKSNQLAVRMLSTDLNFQLIAQLFQSVVFEFNKKIEQPVISKNYTPGRVLIEPPRR